MEDTVVCPICETENAADATHCEVCGERLKPAEPGEEVGAEESVADSFSSGGEVVGFAVEGDDEDATAPADQTADFAPAAFEEEEYYEFDPSEMGSEAQDDSDEAEAGDGEFAHDDPTAADIEALEEELAEAEEEAAEEPADEEAGDTDELEEESAEESEGEGEFAEELDAEAEEPAQAEEEEADEAEDAADEKSTAEDAPEVLYSPLDGTAYHAGTPEYEEGFGPMGEELVAEPPALDEEALSEPEADDARPASEAEAEAEPAGFEQEYDEPATREPSPEFRAAFQAREKERPVMEPLPQPGTYAQPATLTVYVNREPVFRHEIETDETLIGRKDPVSDAYPDLDLTDYDADSHVSRKHAYIYRQNKNYTLYAVSNAGTQLNDELLDLGDRRSLSDGDVIILAGKLAMKFETPDE
jgi:hypothetical protein